MNYMVWVSLFMIVPLVVLIIGVQLWRPAVIWDNTSVIARSMAVLFVIGIIWDSYAIHAGWWYYESHQIVGVWFLGMPLEEFVFIITTSLFYILLTLIGLELWGERQ